MGSGAGPPPRAENIDDRANTHRLLKRPESAIPEIPAVSALSREEGQNAGLGLNKMYVFSVLAQAELAPVADTASDVGPYLQLVGRDRGRSRPDHVVRSIYEVWRSALLCCRLDPVDHSARKVPQGDGRGVQAAPPVLYSIASRSPRHACSQRRQASPQTRQCSCIAACRSHSSPQLLQMATQASSSGRVTLA